MKALWKSIDQKKAGRVIADILMVLIFTVFCCKSAAIAMRDKTLAYGEEIRAEEHEKMEDEIVELRIRLQQEISARNNDIPE